MSILWCGGEDIDFPGLTVTHQSNYRSGYARDAIKTAWGLFGKSTTFPGGAVTSAWLSVQAYGNPTTGWGFIGFAKSSGGNKGLLIGMSSTARKIGVHIYDGSSCSLLPNCYESGFSCGDGVLVKLDMQITGFGTGSGTIKVYAVGNLIIDWSGDLSGIGISDFDCVCLSSYGNGSSWNMSEMIVADEDTRLMSLITQQPNAVGTTDEWGGALGDVNEQTINDGTVNYTNLQPKIQQYNLQDFLAGTYGIRTVKHALRAAKSPDASISTIKLGVKNGANTNVDAGTALTTAWQTVERYMAQDPTTSADWLLADMNGLQSMIQSAT